MDYVLKSPDEASFLQAAYVLGYARVDDETQTAQVISTGISQDGGNYFINVVGTVSEPTGNMIEGPMGPYPERGAIPGYWVRIRVNNGGELPALPIGFELFPPMKYLEDGVTPDPAYTQPPYGCIA